MEYMKPKRRASNMDRLLSCHGSPAVVAKVGERARSDGHEGVMGHWMIADRAIRELGAVPPEGGLPPPDVPAGYTLPSSSLWMVDWAIRHLKETIPADWTLMVELEMEWEFDRWVATGHSDVVAMSPDGKRVKGKDWKFVYVPVEDAEENDQILTYIVLLKQAWPDIEEIEFEICSMRLSSDERITSVTVAGNALDACIADLDRRNCEALDNAWELNTGLKQCKWCVGCSCPAIQALNTHMKFTLTPEALAKIKALPDDGTLADFVIDGMALKKPLDDAKEMLHERLDKVPSVRAGCGLNVSRKITKGDIEIKDPVKYMQNLRIVLPDDDSIARVVSPSKTRIIDEIAKQRDLPKTSKDQPSATAIYDGHLAPLTTQKDKRTFVVS